MSWPATADNPDAGHFDFGKNWRRFLTLLNEERIESSKTSLQNQLHLTSLDGMTFLDAGCGSGLFSLAARRLGAQVTSIDLDPDSIACAEYLKSRFDPQTQDWRVMSGSLLNADFLASLGEFHVVYCWGVAHHTGHMWKAIENLIPRVMAGGTLVLAIYNDQQYISRYWTGVKRIYQQLPALLRPLYVAGIGTGLFLSRLIMTILACLLRLVTLRNPLVPIINWIREVQPRGMHTWHDLVDWVGGWPFEVAKPEEIFRFLRDRGFILTEMMTSGGHGCNEFVFVRRSVKDQ